MKARYKYRICPTPKQASLLAKVFGCSRVVYNDALRLCKESEKIPSSATLQKICITEAKKKEERSWLKDVSNIPLQQSIADLSTALSNFFNSRKGKRKGEKMGFPSFKKKQSAQSIRFARHGFSLKNGKLFLAKMGLFKVEWSRALPSIPSSVTIVKNAAGQYFASFVVEIEPEIVDPINNSIGIDLGLKTFAVLSDGTHFSSPDYKALTKKISRLQRRLSKAQKGSNRRKALKLKIAKLHQRKADKRSDFLHKASTKIVRENQSIILEDLNVSGMMKNRKLSKAIGNAGWSMFRSMCEAKATKFLRDFRVISRWEPTSQTCSSCGFKWGKLDLKVRDVVCVNCGVHHDRDINAAININKVGVGHTHDPKRTQRSCKSPLGATIDEASTHPEKRQLCLF
jgi:putative transposase